MKKKVVFLPYDMDTAIGINNEGSLVFSYGLEDTDQTEGGADIFNGQQSVLWKNLRDNFGPELKAMYQQLRSKGTISYDVVEKMFEDHQAKWPEAIFNEDAWFKYLAPLEEDNNAAYLAMLQGSKASQRKWWLNNRFKYLDSKYNAGEALTDVITVRGYAKDNVTVIPYADVYAAVKFGSYLTQKRAKRGEAVTLECPLSNVNDTEIYIYSAGQLASVGDLSGLKVGYADFSTAVKLQDIKLGDKNSSYRNGNLQTLYLGNNTLLQTIDIRNCSGLGTGDQTTVDISGCKNVRYVYFEGTNISGLTLPDGGVLETLHLPGTITILKILNQTRLTDLSCPDMSHVTTLWLDNIGATIDIVEILGRMTTGSRVRLFHFDWNMPEAHGLNTFIDLLDVMRGLDQNGNNTDTAQVYGSVHIPAASTWLLNKAEKYKDLKVTYDSLRLTVLYYNYDSSIVDFELVESGDNASREVNPVRPMSNTTVYTFDGWSSAPDGDVDDSLLNGITADKSVYAHYAESVRYYTVRFYNGNILEETQQVTYGSYARFADGNRTPVYNGEGYAEDYNFIGWDADLTKITSDVDTHALYAYNPVFARKYLQNRLTEYTDSAVADPEIDVIDYVGDYAFAGNTRLEELFLPSLKFTDWRVPKMAFAFLESIRDFTFSTDLTAVKSIEEYAFYSFMNENKRVDSAGHVVTSDLEFPNATSVGQYAFFGMGTFNLSLPALTAESSLCFASSYIVRLNLQSLKQVVRNRQAYSRMTRLREIYWSSISGTITPTYYLTTEEDNDLVVADIGSVSSLNANFKLYNGLSTLILRNTAVVKFASSNLYSDGAFADASPLGTGAGAIYVPENLIYSYKTAAGWSQYADMFTPIEGSPYDLTKEDS